MVTKLRELLDKGYTVMQSSLVQPGTHVTYDTEEATVIAVNPWDYPYLDFENPFDAHAFNMAKICTRIERMADEALERLNKMVDEMNRKHEPRVVSFFPNVEVEENEDGTFSFMAAPYDPSKVGHQLIFEGTGPSSEFMRQKRQEALGWLNEQDVPRSYYDWANEPTFDELISGDVDPDEDPYLTFDEYMNWDDHGKTG